MRSEKVVTPSMHNHRRQMLKELRYSQYTSCSTTGSTGFPSTCYGVAGRVISKFDGKK